MSTIAVTGGTGFVGAHFLTQAVAAGHSIRALTRREQETRENISWMRGDLESGPALEKLCQGADAIIHIAGAISAPHRAGFAKANIEGTETMLDAAAKTGVRRFIHISSLAAREPDLSLYGWSKAESETLVNAADLDTTIIRPPAVYGPGDRETLELFAMAAKGRIILPPPGRLSLIYIADLCALFLACINATDTIGKLYEPDDGHPGGITHREFGQALGDAVGRSVKTYSMPAIMVQLGARLDTLFRGKNAKLTPDRARYFCHPDWTTDPAKHPDPQLWQAAIQHPKGLAETATWYREAGWID